MRRKRVAPAVAARPMPARLQERPPGADPDGDDRAFGLWMAWRRERHRWVAEHPPDLSAYRPHPTIPDTWVPPDWRDD